MLPVNTGSFEAITFGFTISASDLPDDAPRVSDDDVNRLTYLESARVLREGGRLVLGHRWKPGGIMHHLASKARDLRIGPFSAQQLEQPVIINVIAWPDCPPADSDRDAQRLLRDNVLQITVVSAPDVNLDHVDPESETGFFFRIRSLTAMRKRLCELTDVRICLGGGANKPQRRISGILEEATLTIAAEKPLYICSAMGGISRVLCDAMLQRRLSESDTAQFVTPAPARAVLEKFRAEYPFPVEEGPCSINHGDRNVWNALDYLRSVKLDRLAEIAGLTLDEYINLMTTADLDRVITLVTMGVRNLRRRVAIQD